MVSKNAGKQKQVVVKMEIGAGGGAGRRAGRVDEAGSPWILHLRPDPGWPILARYISKKYFGSIRLSLAPPLLTPGFAQVSLSLNQPLL